MCDTEKYYKEVKDVVKNSYVIGSYQRGYRWDEENVIELLNDIYEGKLVEKNLSPEEISSDSHNLIYSIMQKSSKAKYCLQPLVVRKSNDQYSVIDGQQRLTTLFIILKVLSNISDNIKFPETFSIKYKSRERSKEFLDSLSENSQPDNIDAAYMKQSYITAQKWFLKKNEEFISHLSDCSEEDPSKLNSAFAGYLRGILKENTRFIWDDVDDDSKDNEQKIFADRNTGKLDLTDSELIKSIFMNPEYYGEKKNNIKDRQILISELWDIYENDLHDDDFWAFLPLSPEKKKEYADKTRIDAIFWLLGEKTGCRAGKEEHGLYKAIQSWIDSERKKNIQSDSKSDRKAETMYYCWRETCNLIDGIKELYKNNEVYNLLYLFKMVEDNNDAVRKIYLSLLDENKSNRAGKIKKEIREKLFADKISDTIKNTRYPDGKIKNLLLAYNISIVNSTVPVERFAFKYFDCDAEEDYLWDKEHIYASNETYIGTASLEEKTDVLKILHDNSYKDYINYLFDLDKDKENIYQTSDGNTLYGIDAMQADYTEKNPDKSFVKYCFDKSEKKYDKYFEIWRCLQLKDTADDLLKRIEIIHEINDILNEPDITRKKTKMESFFQNTDYDNGSKLIFLTADYLFWDEEIASTFLKMKDSGKKTDKIVWHGYTADIPDPDTFWKSDADDTAIHDNFRRNYYRKLLGEIYDNTGIASKDVGLDRHGPRNRTIVNANNIDLLFSLLKGTVYRINKKIDDFFIKTKSISPSDTEKGNPNDYTAFADYINDNSMGNMMLLPAKINRDGKYRAANFAGKRKRFTEIENTFTPVASSNVLMGKFNDLRSGIQQWLMAERLSYLKDMIGMISNYFE